MHKNKVIGLAAVLATGMAWATPDVVIKGVADAAINADHQGNKGNTATLGKLDVHLRGGETTDIGRIFFDAGARGTTVKSLNLDPYQDVSVSDLYVGLLTSAGSTRIGNQQTLVNELDTKSDTGAYLLSNRTIAYSNNNYEKNLFRIDTNANYPLMGFFTIGGTSWDYNHQVRKMYTNYALDFRKNDYHVYSYFEDKEFDKSMAVAHHRAAGIGADVTSKDGYSISLQYKKMKATQIAALYGLDAKQWAAALQVGKTTGKHAVFLTGEKLSELTYGPTGTQDGTGAYAVSLQYNFKATPSAMLYSRVRYLKNGDNATYGIYGENMKYSTWTSEDPNRRSGYSVTTGFQLKF